VGLHRIKITRDPSTALGPAGKNPRPGGVVFHDAIEERAIEKVGAGNVLGNVQGSSSFAE